MEKRLAVVLRGPMGVGKSTVAKNLASKFSSGPVVNLDEGWCIDQIRYCGGSSRYNDIRKRQEKILFIELACGEPVDLNFPGATSNAGEWIEILNEDKRVILYFFIWGEWDSIQARMKSRRSENLLIARLWHNAFEQKLGIVSFPEDIGILEEKIDTTGMDRHTVEGMIESSIRKTLV